MTTYIIQMTDRPERPEGWESLTRAEKMEWQKGLTVDLDKEIRACLPSCEIQTLSRVCMWLVNRPEGDETNVQEQVQDLAVVVTEDQEIQIIQPVLDNTPNPE